MITQCIADAQPLDAVAVKRAALPSGLPHDPNPLRSRRMREYTLQGINDSVRGASHADKGLQR